MVAKTVDCTCPECDSEYSITATNWESIDYCPFCGSSNRVPYDDLAQDALEDEFYTQRDDDDDEDDDDDL